MSEDVYLRLKKFVDDDRCLVPAHETFYSVPFGVVSDAMQTIEELRGELATTKRNAALLGTMYKELRTKHEVLRAENEALTRAMQNIEPLGHDDDCMFCGFKDKQARIALNLPTSDPKEDTNHGQAPG